MLITHTHTDALHMSMPTSDQAWNMSSRPTTTPAALCRNCWNQVYHNDNSCPLVQ